MPVLVAATGGTERHSLVLELALRPMFSYLHAIVSPTGIYAATHDFGAGDTGSGDQEGAAITARLARAAVEFARLVGACGPHRRRDAFDDDVATMQQLLTGTGDDRDRRRPRRSDERPTARALIGSRRTGNTSYPSGVQELVRVERDRPREASSMETLTQRWDRATFLFDAGDYISAARALADIVADAPDAGAARLLLARAYYTPPS